MKKTILLIISICSITLLFSASYALPKNSVNGSDNNYIQYTAFPWSSSEIPGVLGWTPAENICGGFYAEPEIIFKYPHPAGMGEEQTIITATEPTLLSETGTSVLQGNVTVTQEGRQITSDKAYINRDPATGKISTIDMVGNVHWREAGKIVVAERVHIDLEKKVYHMSNAIYRFTKKTEEKILNAWGMVREGEREATGILNLYHATYSTCPPTSNTWKVRAGHLHLDRESGVGTATNSFLDLQGFPIFYLPYFTFPLDDRRKSGFLFPTVAYSSRAGTDISIPYYLNLAPNYDATLTPRIITERGVQGNILFRYLTATSYGHLYAGYLPSDQLFKQFQEDAPVNYATSPAVYLNRLESESDNRGYFSYADNTIFNPHWSASLGLNYVTDDYYFQDFAGFPGLMNNDQLLNEGDLNYQSDHWRFLGRLQGYETLHPINEGPIQDQYSRLPELDLSADYPNQAYNLDYQLDTQFVDFDHANDFLTGTPIVHGRRYNFNPAISWPFVSTSGYFTPKLQLDETSYSLEDQIPGLSSNLSRTLPLFDVDSGLYFDRNFNWFDHSYHQTLEPRLFYLYVPTVNQNDIPLFDTILPPFDFDELFQTNRFTGIDRIGDANQITLALTTRFLDDFTGEERMRASIGEIYYFHQREVCALPNCIDDPTAHDHVSPLAGELSYNLNTNWNVTSDIAWDPNRAQTNYGALNFIYHPGDGRILNVGYNFTRGADPLNPLIPIPINTSKEENNLNRINLGAAWPVTQRWSVVGDWNYNISHGHPQVYFYGAQYDSCCWAVRFLASHTLIAENGYGNAQYDPEFYIQFQLKGLGNIGNSDPGTLLTGMIPGYRDIFGGTGPGNSAMLP